MELELLRALAPEMTTTTILLLMAAGVGFGSLAREINKTRRRQGADGLIAIIVCVLGMVGICYLIEGITVVHGIILGFAASGSLTGLSFIGKKSSDTNVAAGGDVNVEKTEELG